MNIPTKTIHEEILKYGLPFKLNLYATKNITWNELLINQTDIPTIGILENLLNVAKVLQIYRDKIFKMPITITNGWRSEKYHHALYKKINDERKQKGLVPLPVPEKSTHLLGLAVDFTVKNWTVPMIFDVMDRVHFGGVERTDGNWSHIDLRKQNVRFTPSGVILNPHFNITEHDKIFKEV